jgi:hypothetical protein
MSPAFESFLARLYVDAKARARFLADPGREAAAAGLTDQEIAAAVRIDRVGLELASASFEHKRRRHRKRFSPVRWLWGTIFGRGRPEAPAARAGVGPRER